MRYRVIYRERESDCEIDRERGVARGRLRDIYVCKDVYMYIARERGIYIYRSNSETDIHLYIEKYTAKERESEL